MTKNSGCMCEIRLIVRFVDKLHVCLVCFKCFLYFKPVIYNVVIIFAMKIVNEILNQKWYEGYFYNGGGILTDCRGQIEGNDGWVFAIQCARDQAT